MKHSGFPGYTFIRGKTRALERYRGKTHGPQLLDRIDRHRWTDLERKRYVREYVLPLNPVIITEGIEHWVARKKWTLDFFRQKYGGLPLTVDGRQLEMGEPD